jgi:cytidylate kinase
MKATQIIEHINNILSEGVYDPSIFKAIFMAGGGGSGKGFIVERVVKGLGYKVVNTDDMFEFLMKKSGKSLDLGSYEDPTDYDPEREGGKIKTNKRKTIYMKGRLGLVIDGTADKFDKIEKAKKYVEKFGYDTYMIFVDTSLEVAKARNQKRDRKVPEDIVIEAWELAQANKVKFKALFKGNMDVIDNSNILEKDDGLIKVARMRVMEFSRLPSKHPKSLTPEEEKALKRQEKIKDMWIKRKLDKKKEGPKIIK